MRLDGLREGRREKRMKRKRRQGKEEKHEIEIKYNVTYQNRSDQ